MPMQLFTQQFVSVGSAVIRCFLDIRAKSHVAYFSGGREWRSKPFAHNPNISQHMSPSKMKTKGGDKYGD